MSVRIVASLYLGIARLPPKAGLIEDVLHKRPTRNRSCPPDALRVSTVALAHYLMYARYPNVCSLCIPSVGMGCKGAYSLKMGIGAVSELVGRSPDALRRWEKAGLVTPLRDRHGRRSYTPDQVARCRELARLAPHAQRRSTKLAEVAREPVQLALF